MSEELYTQSKELGLDYLKDRKEVSLNPKYSYSSAHEFDLYSELSNLKFDKEAYLKVCERQFDSFKSSVETNDKKISSGVFSTNYGYEDNNASLEVYLYRYESETEFIKRIEKENKAKIAKQNKELREANQRKKDAKKILKTMTPEEIQEAIKGVKGLTYNA